MFRSGTSPKSDSAVGGVSKGLSSAFSASCSPLSDRTPSQQPRGSCATLSCAHYRTGKTLGEKCMQINKIELYPLVNLAAGSGERLKGKCGLRSLLEIMWCRRMCRHFET